MGCPCSKKLEKERCPDGYQRDTKTNQCLDAQGNPYVPTATDGDKKPKRKLNLRDVERYKGRGEDIEFDEKKSNTFLIPEEKSKKIKQNMKKVRLYIQRLARDKKFAPVLLPLTTYNVAYDFCVRKYSEMLEKAKTEQQKKQAQIYADTIDEIFAKVPESVDFEKTSLDDAKALLDKLDSELRSEMQSLKAKAKESGKSSEEYARYRAYADYLKMCETKSEQISNRIQAGKYLGQLEEHRKRFKSD